jgi:hypothetical protein
MKNRRKAALAGSTDPASNLPAMKVPPHKSMVKTKEIYVITGINSFPWRCIKQFPVSERKHILFVR